MLEQFFQNQQLDFPYFTAIFWEILHLYFLNFCIKYKLKKKEGGAIVSLEGNSYLFAFNLFEKNYALVKLKEIIKKYKLNLDF